MGILAADRTRSAARGWEHRREADEAVEGNLSPDERALWRRLKGKWKGTPHARLEAFQKYLHDHPDELRAERSGYGETRAKALVRERKAQAFVSAPCAPPLPREGAPSVPRLVAPFIGRRGRRRPLPRALPLPHEGPLQPQGEVEGARRGAAPRRAQGRL